MGPKTDLWGALRLLECAQRDMGLSSNGWALLSNNNTNLCNSLICGTLSKACAESMIIKSGCFVCTIQVAVQILPSGFRKSSGPGNHAGSQQVCYLWLLSDVTNMHNYAPGFATDASKRHRSMMGRIL